MHWAIRNIEQSSDFSNQAEVIFFLKKNNLLKLN